MTTPELAVQRCVKAYYDACDHEDPQYTGLSQKGWVNVRIAYRHAMPYLTPDPDAIDAFIACVAHGLIIQAFEPAEASKLLYAAQVAIGSRRTRQQSNSEPKSQTHPAASPDLKPAATPPPPISGRLCNSVTL